MAVNAEDQVEAMAACARLYFLEDRSKTEIATELGLSRFKVARLISTAREVGLVSITVHQPPQRRDELARRLRTAFGLREAVVVASSAGFDTAGEATAALLCTALEPGDLLGMGWGRSVDAVVAALSGRAGVPSGVGVVQLAGGLTGSDPAFDPSGVAARAAASLGGPLHQLHAPAFLASASTRDALLQEPEIATTLRAGRALSVALVGIGALGPDPDSALVAGDALPALARKQLTALGANADVVCHFFDADGAPVGAWEDRTVAVPMEAFSRTPLRVGVAVGHRKAGAVLSVLRASIIDVLVTDSACALAVLSGMGPERRAEAGVSADGPR